MKQLLFVYSFLAFSVLLSAQDITLAPSQDNTLYQDATGSLSNGEGPHLFVGQTAQDRSRRALLAFDLSGIAPGTPVQSATLELNLSLEPTLAAATGVSVHRVDQSWGEGPSSTGNAPGGSGVASQVGDATWLHTFFNSDTWNSPGGDFNATPSATVTVDDPGTYQWTGAAFAADVQGWVDDPDSNYGLVLVGDESSTRNARRFDSREGGIAPSLRVTFGAVPEPSTIGLLFFGASLLFFFRRRTQ